MSASVRRFLNRNSICQAALMVLGLLAVSAFAQSEAQFTSQMQTATGTIWTYVKIALQIGLFLLLIFKVYNAFFGHDKEGAWWQIVTIIAFIVLIQILPAMYQTITGSTVAPLI
jgi:hypothetical protein